MRHLRYRGLIRLQYFFFFFFQAEDGIRDLTVTGVQTCALPISTHTPSSFPSSCSSKRRSPPSSPIIMSGYADGAISPPWRVLRNRACYTPEIGRASCRERV